MKMYKIDDIIELLQGGKKSDNEYVGFRASGEGDIVIILKEHAPGWRDSDGFGEAVEELEMLGNAGEY